MLLMYAHNYREYSRSELQIVMDVHNGQFS